jgi:cell division septation protein DedD
MKKTIAIVLAIACALAVFVGCTRSGAYYYPRTFVAQDNNDNPGQLAAQNTHYYFGPYISVVTGILTSKTTITTERRGNSATYIYMLNTANPINISKVNIPDDSDAITANNIAAFELAVCNMNLSAYIGSKVRLTGQFTLCDSGNDSTRVVMNVSKVEVYNTVPVSQRNAQGNVQSSAQGKTQSSAQGKTQSNTQSNTQSGTQINTQINAQGNAQVNAQINIQNNTQNSTQSNTQSARTPVPAAKKPTQETKPKTPPKPATTVSQRPPPKAKTYRIQVGAFCDPANAQKAVTRLQCQNLNPVKEKYKQYTRVVLRGIPANKVDNTVAAAKRAGFNETWIQME